MYRRVLDEAGIAREPAAGHSSAGGSLLATQIWQRLTGIKVHQEIAAVVAPTMVVVLHHHKKGLSHAKGEHLRANSVASWLASAVRHHEALHSPSRPLTAKNRLYQSAARCRWRRPQSTMMSGAGGQRTQQTVSTATQSSMAQRWRERGRGEVCSGYDRQEAAQI